jgi:hypothetical protein
MEGCRGSLWEGSVGWNECGWELNMVPRRGGGLSMEERQTQLEDKLPTLVSVKHTSVGLAASIPTFFHA